MLVRGPSGKAEVAIVLAIDCGGASARSSATDDQAAQGSAGQRTAKRAASNRAGRAWIRNEGTGTGVVRGSLASRATVWPEEMRQQVASISMIAKIKEWVTAKW